MHSFTSSSERFRSDMPWMKAVAAALLLFIALGAFMETRLTHLGYVPTPVNAEVQWASERARASSLGKRALILVGQSRILLGVDLDTIRRETGLEPVQLAIDGNSETNILEGLAADPRITGTILVDYYDWGIGASGDVSVRYQKYYEKHEDSKAGISPYEWTENILTDLLHRNLASYSEGASPFSSLMDRIRTGKTAQHLLVTRPDRSVLADFSKVSMPEYYYRRVADDLWVNWNALPSDKGAVLAEKTREIHPVENPAFMQEFTHDLESLKHTVSMIQQHGGRVFFVAMPTSGLVKEIEERRFPKSLYWDRFVTMVGAPAIRAADNDLFRDFQCPDGSHLDYRDRERYTKLLLRALKLDVEHNT